jgi:hypothetical protein
MDSSIITILIAVAIIGYQIYSEKKKRENAKARAMGIQPQQHEEDDPREKLRREISSLFAGVVPEEEDHYNAYDMEEEDSDETSDSLYSEDPFDSIINKTEAPKTAVHLDIIPKIEGESILQNNMMEGRAKSEQIDVTGDIYDSKAISEHNYTQEYVKPVSVFGKDFDPRLFIIYSELATPKYRE